MPLRWQFAAAALFLAKSPDVRPGSFDRIFLQRYLFTDEDASTIEGKLEILSLCFLEKLP